jgi:hypothetical protein
MEIGESVRLRVFSNDVRRRHLVAGPLPLLPNCIPSKFEENSIEQNYHNSKHKRIDLVVVWIIPDCVYFSLFPIYVGICLNPGRRRSLGAVIVHYSTR